MKQEKVRLLPSTQNTKEWIGIDLDGTLSTAPMENGNIVIDPNFIGDPVPAMVTKMLNLVDSGYRVKIFTPRVADNFSSLPDMQRILIKNWQEKNGLPEIEVTATTDVNQIYLYSSRSLQVKSNSGEICCPLSSPDEKLSSNFMSTINSDFKWENPCSPSRPVDLKEKVKTEFEKPKRYFTTGDAEIIDVDLITAFEERTSEDGSFKNFVVCKENGKLSYIPVALSDMVSLYTVL